MKRERMLYGVAFWVAGVILAGVLLMGWPKLADPAAFALAISRYRLLPDVLVNAAALYIPWLELLCAGCVVWVPCYRRAALWVILGLLTVFTTGAVVALIRGASFGCGCFSLSPLAEPMSWFHVVRNGALVLLSGCALVAERRMQA